MNLTKIHNLYLSEKDGLMDGCDFINEKYEHNLYSDCYAYMTEESGNYRLTPELAAPLLRTIIERCAYCEKFFHSNLDPELMRNCYDEYDAIAADQLAAYILGGMATSIFIKPIKLIPLFVRLCERLKLDFDDIIQRYNVHPTL